MNDDADAKELDTMNAYPSSSWRTTIALAIVGITLIGGAAAVLTQGSTLSSANAAEVTASPDDLAAVSPRLIDAASRTDALPGYLTSGSQALLDVVPATTRFLGTDSKVKFYLSQGTAAQVCLIAVFPGKLQLAAYTCAPVERVQDSGISLQAIDEEAVLGVSAYFVPTGYATSVDSFRNVGEQLLVSSAFSTAEPPVLESLSGDSSLTFDTLGRP